MKPIDVLIDECGVDDDGILTLVYVIKYLDESVLARFNIPLNSLQEYSHKTGIFEPKELSLKFGAGSLTISKYPGDSKP